MRKLRFLTILLLACLALSFASPYASALSAPRLKSSDAYLVVDMKTGTELVSLEPDMQHSIASLTKMMTCLLAVEAVENGKVSLDDMVTAQDDCLQGMDVSSSNAGITPGETMSFRDLLYCALVHSANDACNVIAVHVAGSIASFVSMMNARAQELGCENTHFMDTDGMLNRSEGHYSSPRDLYKIASEAMSHTLFSDICGTADYTVSATNKRPAFEVHNSNALMSSKGIYGDQYIYSGVTGIKTGFTKPAGYCLVSVCERNGNRIMCIVLGCNGPLTYTFAGEYQNFQDSITLYDWAFSNFSARTVFLAGEPLKRLSVKFAKDNGTVALCPDQSLNLFIAKEIPDSDIVVDIRPYEDMLTAPIGEGDELGYADVYVDSRLITTVRMVADANVEMERGELMKAKIRDFFSSSGFRIAVISVISVMLLFFVWKSYRKVIRRRMLKARIAERKQAKWTEETSSYAAREEARRRFSGKVSPEKATVRDMPHNHAPQRISRSPQNGGYPAQEQPRPESVQPGQSPERRVPIEHIEVRRSSAPPPQPPREQRRPVIHESTAPHTDKRPETPKPEYDLDDILNSFK